MSSWAFRVLPVLFAIGMVCAAWEAHRLVLAGTAGLLGATLAFVLERDLA